MYITGHRGCVQTITKQTIKRPDEISNLMLTNSYISYVTVLALLSVNEEQQRKKN